MMFIFNRTVLHYIGNDGVVTYTIIAYVNTVVINLMMGVSQGSQPLISFYYGEGSREKCNTLLKYGVHTVTAMAAIVFVGLYIFSNQVVGMFLKDVDDSLIAYSVSAFRTYSFSYIILGFNVLIGGFMTALERPRQATAISIGRGLVLQSISLMALSLSFGADGIWYIRRKKQTRRHAPAYNCADLMPPLLRGRVPSTVKTDSASDGGAGSFPALRQIWATR